MPKRTNAFQKMVHLMHEQLSPFATVTESRMLYDAAAKVPREVDVVIEFPHGLGARQVGVECRDHKTKQDVIWIESVVTKHRDLGLDHSILVSATPFTRAAVEKAATHGVTLVSMEKALKVDWEVLLGDCSSLWWAEWKATASVEASLGSGITAPVHKGMTAYTADRQVIGELDALLLGQLSELNILEQVGPEQKVTGTISLKPEPSIWLEDISGALREVCEFKLSFRGKTPPRVKLSLRTGRLHNVPIAFGVGIASVSQGGPAGDAAPREDKKMIEIFFIQTSEAEALSMARVLHPDGKIDEAKMTPLRRRSDEGT